MAEQRTENRWIEIPLRDTEEVIELDLEQLPDGEEVLSILQHERAQLHIWLTLGLQYYRQGQVDDFVKIFEASRVGAALDYRDYQKDQMQALDTLAAHQVQLAHREKNKDLKKDLFREATKLYTMADKILMYDLNHLLGRALFCLLEGRMEQADAQFNFVLVQSSNNIPALLGKACILFNRKDFKGALGFYKKALRTNPQCPGSVRMGMGYCFARLGHNDKAKLAFERALELDPKCVGALVGLALMEMNQGEPESIRKGVQLLSNAYTLDSANPMVLNNLANHFFFKKDYTKVQHLALHAFHGTENEAMRSESCYQLARSFHSQGDYDKAFKYYYQATQFASQSFVLPFFGLGQMYLEKNDSANAAQCFDRVAKACPKNYETIKILGSLNSKSKEQEKKEQAKEHLKKVTTEFPDDVEAWIELAGITEQTDTTAALTAYEKAVDILQNKVHAEIPPEIANNMAVLYCRQNDFAKAEPLLTKASECVQKEGQDEDVYYHSITITILYNMARLMESRSRMDEAEALYKRIIKEQPMYIDCYLRLGCMARTREQWYEASEWFKEGLLQQPEHPDAWALIGNLHFSKLEWGPGQKKFEFILKQAATANDPYAQLALGNVWLQTLHVPTKEKAKELRHQQRTLSIYKQVLRNDAKNLYAANGVGAVLAHKGAFREARDVFAQVREATADIADVWLNLAHIYVEQKQYVSAIQMYENCQKKFYRGKNVEVMLYIARAYFKAGRLDDCKRYLVKARHISPHDTVLLFNEALVMQRLASSVLRSEKSTLRTVLKSIAELEMSQQSFRWLARHGDRMKFDLAQADSEARLCSDLLSQAKYHEARARRLDEEEREAKQRQEKERETLLEEKRRAEMEKAQKKEDDERRAAEQRELFRQKTSAILQFQPDPTPSRSGGGSRSKRAKQTGDLYSDDEMDEAPKRKRGRKAASGDAVEDGDSSDDGAPAKRQPRSRKRNPPADGAKPRSRKRRGRDTEDVSKAKRVAKQSTKYDSDIIDTEDDESTDDDARKAKKAQRGDDAVADSANSNDDDDDQSDKERSSKAGGEDDTVDDDDDDDEVLKIAPRGDSPASSSAEEEGEEEEEDPTAAAAAGSGGDDESTPAVRRPQRRIESSDESD
eukprot:scpid24561/ scgid20224/ RNA polymerase-associated protein CTR9 homolog; SH2 domain-binding protein 1; Tetratricopeptide repeat-containing, SH2-binding phosphoprotein of 150 kDa